MAADRKRTRPEASRPWQGGAASSSSSTTTTTSGSVSGSPSSAASEDSDDVVRITPLGAGSEVGRSCILLSYKGKKVLLDCGVHPGRNGMSALPYFDKCEPSEIDLLLVSHFHLDHAAALPFFLEKTTFGGRVYMTHPTKQISKMLLKDYLRVSQVAVDNMLYSEADLERSFEKVRVVNYRQEVSHNGIKFHCYNAGHVLGAAMFMIEIAGCKIFYTGDFSRERDRHLMKAEKPAYDPDILIIESTYGVQNHEPRNMREQRFVDDVRAVVSRGGKCLIPVFALGRAQELLLILDEFWKEHKELHRFKIYYASALANKMLTIYQTYKNMMTEEIRNRVDNPFKFAHIENIDTDRKDLLLNPDNRQPCVVMASPGMLQSGLSRELFEAWCGDPKNGTVIPGYSVEGTLAKQLISNPSTIKTTAGIEIPMKLTVRYVSFAAHADYRQTSRFVAKLHNPPDIVLVHGESNEMHRLKDKLSGELEGQSVVIHTPRNCDTVEVEFRAPKIAKTVGKLASHGLQPTLSGVLVQKDYTQLMLLDPSELDGFTQLATGEIMQRQLVPYTLDWNILQEALHQVFDSVSSAAVDDNAAATPPRCLVVHGELRVSHVDAASVQLEWPGHPATDLLADAVVALVAQLQASPAVAKLPAPEARQQRLGELMLLLGQHADPHFDDKQQRVVFTLRGAVVAVDPDTLDVSCSDPKVCQIAADIINRFAVATQPVRSDQSDLVCSS